MAQASRSDAGRAGRQAGCPYHVTHPTFEARGAEAVYGRESAPADEAASPFMPDDLTRELARRMHYAAWRAGRARAGADRARWLDTYRHFRDRVVVGNRKLIFRAVRRWSPPPALADDLAGDCQIVLIQAVAAYNPWLGVRFSTYAFTCLMRALSRLSQKHAGDRAARWLPLDAVADGELSDRSGGEAPSPLLAAIDALLRDARGPLSPREREVLARRFRLEEGAGGTLEQVGRELGLSKERVRQEQASALGKLRAALGASTKSPAGI